MPSVKKKNIYLETSPDNGVFKLRGAVPSDENVKSFAAMMAKGGLRVAVLTDVEDTMISLDKAKPGIIEVTIPDLIRKSQKTVFTPFKRSV